MRKRTSRVKGDRLLPVRVRDGEGIAAHELVAVALERRERADGHVAVAVLEADEAAYKGLKRKGGGPLAVRPGAGDGNGAVALLAALFDGVGKPSQMDGRDACGEACAIRPQLRLGQAHFEPHAGFEVADHVRLR